MHSPDKIEENKRLSEHLVIIATPNILDIG
jgi:hypothetical protein